MSSAMPLAGTMFPNMFPKQGLVGVVVPNDLAVALPESDVFQVGLCQLQVGEGDGIAINRDIPFVSGVFQQSNLAHGLESAGVAEAMRRLVLDSAIQINGMRPSSPIWHIQQYLQLGSDLATLSREVERPPQLTSESMGIRTLRLLRSRRLKPMQRRAKSAKSFTE